MIELVLIFFAGSVFLFCGILFTIAVITKKETEDTMGSVNLPWYNRYFIIPGWMNNIIGAIICLGTGILIIGLAIGKYF